MPTLRHKLAALMGTVAMIGAVFLLGGGGAAQAQSYPPGTSVPSCTVGNVNAGTIAVGQTVTFNLCGDFASGSAVNVTVNGVSVPAKTAANGAVTVVITVVSQTTLSVNDPVNVAAVCGTNTAIASGAKNGGGTGTSTGTFNLVCTSSTTSSSGLAFTGANVIEALLIAAALIVIGALLVVFQRRRRQTI